MREKAEECDQREWLNEKVNRIEINTLDYIEGHANLTLSALSNRVTACILPVSVPRLDKGGGRR